MWNSSSVRTLSAALFSVLMLSACAATSANTSTASAATVPSKKAQGNEPFWQVQIFPTLCRDTMSGMVYPESATLTFNGEKHSGCAGEPLTVLAGTEWQVKSIRGQAVPNSVQVTLSLDEERVYGTSGCNRYFGAIQLTGEGLSFGQIAGTRMACLNDQVSETEWSFLSALADVRRFDIGAKGELMLFDENGVIITATKP
jgi:heat shock protein HslJ